MDILNIKAGTSDYNVNIESGLRHSIAKELKKAYPKSRFAVITDDNVFSIYGRQIKESFTAQGLDHEIISVAPGEKTKSFGVLADIASRLAQAKYNRADVIVAIGGGVVGDLAGFAASVFLRGISYVQVPTTLLSQIDSSVGGKTAVNIPEGKNLVGAFYHPKAVYIDTEFLQTLSSEIFADGMAEMIKYALIRDKEMFGILEQNDISAKSEMLKDMIIRCLAIKRDVVAADEKDKGERMILNFGHTIGHSLERICAGTKRNITHGQGVACGMAVITAASERLGETQKGSTARIVDVLKKNGLPFSIDDFDKQDILNGIFVDKKNVADKLNIILIKKPGSVFIKQITKQEMTNYL